MEDTSDHQAIRDELYVNQFYRYHMISDYAVLKLAVRDDLLCMYEDHVRKHNESIEQTMYPNSGFDLFVPNEVVFAEQFKTEFVNLGVKGEMIYCSKNMDYLLANLDSDDTDEHFPIGISYKTAYNMYPRSSISKTPLLLANHVGIIDCGYRGDLIAAVRSFESGYTIQPNTRLFQICHPTLCPVFVVIVPESELTSTERGAGGFGSTG